MSTPVQPAVTGRDHSLAGASGEVAKLPLQRPAFCNWGDPVVKPLLQSQKQASIHPRCLQAWSSEEGAEEIFPFPWICLLHARLVPRRHPCQVLKEVFFPEHFTAIYWKSVYYIEPEETSQAGEMAQPDSKPHSLN